MLSDAAGIYPDVPELDYRLNAPFGARCFLTEIELGLKHQELDLVLMHLLALGAF